MDLPSDIYLHFIQYLPARNFYSLSPYAPPIPAIWKFFLQRDFPFQSRNLFPQGIDWLLPNEKLYKSLETEYFIISRKFQKLSDLILQVSAESAFRLTTLARIRLIEVLSEWDWNEDFFRESLRKIFEEIDDYSTGEVLNYRNNYFLSETKEIETSDEEDIPLEISSNAKLLPSLFAINSTLDPEMTNLLWQNNPNIIVWKLIPLIIQQLSNSGDEEWYEMMDIIREQNNYY